MTVVQGISTICLIKFGVLMLTELSGHPYGIHSSKARRYHLVGSYECSV
jgi:hypothetical protein